MAKEESKKAHAKSPEKSQPLLFFEGVLADLARWKKEFAAIAIVLFAVLLLGGLSYLFLLPEEKADYAYWYYVPNAIEIGSQVNSVSETGTQLGLPLPLVSFTASASVFFQFYFLNNFSAAVSSFFSMLLLVPGFFSLLTQGLYQALFFEISLKEAEIYGVNPVVYDLSQFWIHGLPEMFGAFIAYVFGAALALKILFSRVLFRGSSRFEFALKTLHAFVAIVLPLILLAAFLETFVSPPAAQFLNPVFLSKYRDPALGNLIISADAVSSAIGFDVRLLSEEEQQQRFLGTPEYTTRTSTYFSYFFSEDYPKLKDYWTMQNSSKHFESADGSALVSIWLFKPQSSAALDFSLGYMESALPEEGYYPQSDLNSGYPHLFVSEMTTVALGEANGFVELVYADTIDSSRAAALFAEQAKAIK